VLSSICFAVKDAGNTLSEEFYDTLRRQLEKNKDNIKQENQEMVAQAVRDNRNLKNLERFFKSSL
jgi:ribosomal protein S17E